MVISKKELGLLIKDARKIKSEKTGEKFTQKKLADAIQKSQSYIGDIESGRTYPGYEVLSDIAKVCELPFGYFGDAGNSLAENLLNEFDLYEMSIASLEEGIRSEKFKSAIKVLIEQYKNSKKADYKIFTDALITIKDLMETDPKLKQLIIFDLDFAFIKYQLYKHFPSTNPVRQHLIEGNNIFNFPITDVKEALNFILSQPGLMFNGEIMSDESKLALSIGIQNGLKELEEFEKEAKKIK